MDIKIAWTAKIHQTSIDKHRSIFRKKLLDEIQNILITDDFYEKILWLFKRK